MATTQIGAVWRHIEQLTAGRGVDDETDRQLLDDFTARHDHAAFAALVSRHGPMVLRVCRRVLHHEQDAEDAFQATFLVLAQNTGSIRKRDALSAWLHGVAYRTAMKARRTMARRHNHEAHWRTLVPRPASPTWDDTQGVLDEEVLRLPAVFRQAFVLCVLEGKSGAEAAAELGCKEGTVKSRVMRARRLLQQQLARRGIKLTSLLAALSVAESAARAALPAALARAALRFGLLAAAGPPATRVIPSRVAALAAGVARAMFLTKTTMVTAVIAAVGLLIAAGARTHQALRARENEPGVQSPAAASKAAQPSARDKPKSVPADDAKEAVAFSGRVLDPDGKPCAGARLFLVSDAAPARKPAARATAGADGRFRLRAPRSEVGGSPNTDGWPVAAVVATARDYGPDWAVVADGEQGDLTLRLVRNDVLIRGRVLDLQGRPVAGATVTAREVATSPEEDLTPVLKTWQTGQFGAALELTSKVLSDPAVAGLPESVSTDRDGRFRLPGAGRERLVSLSIEAPDIATQTIYVVPRPAPEIRAVVEAGARASLRPGVVPSAGSPLYGTTFDHVATPSRPVTGTVRDRATGQPLAGVEIFGHPAVGDWVDVRAVTDGRGHFRLAGLAKAQRYRLYARPQEDTVYLPVGTDAADNDGLEALRIDFALPHGVEVRGRITDQRTGQPVPYATIRYAPLESNRHPGISAYHFESQGGLADSRGAFRLVVPPGPGVVFAAAQTGRDGNRYTQARLAPADRDKAYKEIPDEAFLAVGGRIETLAGGNAYRLIEPAADANMGTCDLTFDPGLTQAGTVLGADGRPLADAVALGLTAVRPRPVSLRGAGFTAVALDPGSPRDLLFVHAERKLAGHLLLRGDETEAPAVKLEPWGAVAGRIVDADGQPLAGVRMQVTYPRYIPVAWMDRQPEEVRTDRAGRFRVERLIPGMRLTLGASTGQAFLLLGDSSNGMIQVSVGAGETKDLGELRARTSD